MAAGTTNQIREILWNSYNIRVRDDWLQACTEFLITENQGRVPSTAHLCELVYQQWLVADLREIGVALLPDDIAGNISTTVQGPFCLQMNLTVNVGESAYSQIRKMKGQDDLDSFHGNKPNWEANKPTRMLIMELTDGINSIMGMEFQPIPLLKPSTPPGTKVKISGEVICRMGSLLLSSKNTTPLGGEVESLKEENSVWNLLHRAINQEPPVAPVHIAELNSRSDVAVSGISHSNNSLSSSGQKIVNGTDLQSRNSRSSTNLPSSHVSDASNRKHRYGVIRQTEINYFVGPVPSNNKKASCKRKAIGSGLVGKQNTGTAANPVLLDDDNDDYECIDSYFGPDDDFAIDELEQIEEPVQMETHSQETHSIQRAYGTLREDSADGNLNSQVTSETADSFCANEFNFDEGIFEDDNDDDDMGADLERAVAEVVYQAGKEYNPLVNTTNDTNLNSVDNNDNSDKDDDDEDDDDDDDDDDDEDDDDEDDDDDDDDDDDEDDDDDFCGVQPRKKRNLSSKDFKSSSKSNSATSLGSFSSGTAARSPFVRNESTDERKTSMLHASRERQPTSRVTNMPDTSWDRKPKIEMTYMPRTSQKRVSAFVQPLKREDPMATSVGEDLNSRTFSYLADMPPPMTETATVAVRVKAYIATIVSHSKNTRPDWQVTVKLNDGSAAVDADISNKEVLTKLLGFPVDEFRLEMEEACNTTDSAVRQRFQQRNSEFQSNLSSISCFIDLEYSPLCSRPRVVRIVEPTAADVTALMDRVTRKQST